MIAAEWINISNMNQWIRSSSVLSDYVFNQLFGLLILLRGSFHEHIPESRVWYLLLSYLNLCPALLLQGANGLASFSNDEPNAVIWHRDNIGVGRRGTVRSHHGIVHSVHNWLLGIV